MCRATCLRFHLYFKHFLLPLFFCILKLLSLSREKLEIGFFSPKAVEGAIPLSKKGLIEIGCAPHNNHARQGNRDEKGYFIMNRHRGGGAETSSS